MVPQALAGLVEVLYQGEVLKTFPKIEDMINFVYTGTQEYVSAGLKIYGNPDRDGGAHAPLSYNGNPMPQQGEKYGGGLTDAEILGVVCHERYELSGADPMSEEWKAEFDRWCAPILRFLLVLRQVRLTSTISQKLTLQCLRRPLMSVPTLDQLANNQLADFRSRLASNVTSFIW